MPIMAPPRVTFGPKPQPARNVYAKKLAQVRKRYIAGANRRNNAAIKAGIKARTGTATAAPGIPAARPAVVPSGTMGVPAPMTQSLLRSSVALNEVLLSLVDQSSEAATKDPKYQKDCERALTSESTEKKGKYHQRAGDRAAELGCVERAERHHRLAAALAS